MRAISALFASQTWNAQTYERRFGFVSRFGRPVLEFLPPPPCSVLDIGCGDGALAREMLDAGYTVKGVDFDQGMLARARERGVDVAHGDAQLGLPAGPFDAVLTNAALHWMPDQNAVARHVSDALESGDAFVGECGGYGNCAGVRDAIAEVVGHDVEAELCSWTFPAPEAFRNILTANGFIVDKIEHFERPVACDAVEWLQQFGSVYIPKDRPDAFLDEFRASAKRHLKPATTDQGRQGVWVDYVRLRWRATKA
mmetsp:Transcript_13406/g.41382  ORF Transcript_13406/g.41382 Transcript_13406/m.41382 type:complete len:254 (-) Transcript_13406:111-872(-)